MEKAQEKPKTTTTVCVDAVVRDFIAREAEQLGLSQRQMARHIVEAYKRTTNNTADSDEDGLVTKYMRKQEEMFLAPILKAVLNTGANLKVLIEILRDIE